MPETIPWQEVESRVHRPGSWLIFSVGTLFLLVGTIGFLTIGGVVPPGAPLWIAKLGTALFGLLGGLALLSAVNGILAPAYVRHAARDVMPDVPIEPVIREGSTVHGRLTHELWEDAQGWQLHPSQHLWRNDKRYLLGFGIPFLTFFSGLATWGIHSALGSAGWVISAVCGIGATLVSGGTALMFIGMLMRSGYRRLSWLSVPRNGGDLQLDSPEEPNPEKADLADGVKWVFSGKSNRQQLTIPRALVAAVQLCPGKFVVSGSGERETTWAAQGLLVLGSSNGAEYHRLPLLLTSDFVGAARLMVRLAHTLQVPYLFHADAEGWKAEAIRARSRPPLRAGGWQS